jgi:uncharacterized RDD family membrane protein YckC
MSRINSYAGINKRFVAFLIDAILLYFACFIAYGNEEQLWEHTAKFTIYYLCASVLYWAYFAGMESSGLQATLGKKILGIIVTDTAGNKISFWRATGRYFAKSSFVIFWILAGIIALMADTGGDDSSYWLVAGLLFLVGLLVFIMGYVMAAFTPEKQALHDVLARCLVVNGSGQSTAIPWKILVGLVLAAIISGRIIDAIPTVPPNPCETNPTLPECQPPNPCETNPTLPGCQPPNPEPGGEMPREAKEFLNEMPDPPGRNPNIPTRGRFNLCGSDLQLLEYANVNIDGDWKFQFSNGGGAIHVARIKMQRNAGIMRVVFPDNSEASGIGKVQQTMQLYRSSQGLVALGFNPINPDTGNPVTSYQADNFLIRQEWDGSITVRNCDDGGDGSPVTWEHYQNY